MAALSGSPWNFDHHHTFGSHLILILIQMMHWPFKHHHPSHPRKLAAILAVVWGCLVVRVQVPLEEHPAPALAWGPAVWPCKNSSHKPVSTHTHKQAISPQGGKEEASKNVCVRDREHLEHRFLWEHSIPCHTHAFLLPFFFFHSNLMSSSSSVCKRVLSMKPCHFFEANSHIYIHQPLLTRRKPIFFWFFPMGCGIIMMMITRQKVAPSMHHNRLRGMGTERVTAREEFSCSREFSAPR